MVRRVRTRDERHHRPTRLLAALAALVLLTACGGAAGEASGGDEAADTGGGDLGTVTVALSVPESVTFLPADLGVELGVFDECGVQVENIVGESSTVGRSLAAGEADLALQAAPRAVGETMQGIPAKLVAGQKNPWSQVLVVSDALDEAGVTTAEALGESGELISFGISSFGSAGHLSVINLAEEFGWTEGEQYEVVPLGGVNEITAGLEAGAVDAFTWGIDVAYAIETQGVGHVIEDVVADAVGPIIFEGFQASNQFIEERPEALTAYLECYYDFVAELKEDPERVRELAIEEWGKDPAALDLYLEQTVEGWSSDGSATEEELQGLSEAALFQVEGLEEAPVDEWWQHWQDVPTG